MSEIHIKKASFGSPLYREVTELRHEILRKPLGRSFTPEELAVEKDNIHLAACNAAGRVVGTLLIRMGTEGTAQIKRMAIAEEQQSRGIGRMLVRHAEMLMRARGVAILMMHARCTAIGFYEKCGYKAVGGEFLETGIPHMRMEKPLLDK